MTCIKCYDGVIIGYSVRPMAGMQPIFGTLGKYL